MQLPRVICDQCLKDAEVSLVLEYVEWGDTYHLIIVECHDVEQLFHVREPRGGDDPKDPRSWTSLPATVILSELRKHQTAYDDYQLDDKEAICLKKLTEPIELLLVVNRVRRNHGRPRTYIDQARLDRVIDALLLFHEEKVKP